MSEEQLNRFSDIIIKHFSQRYPNSFEQTGLSKKTILNILEKKRSLLANKDGLTQIINIIDNVIRMKINGPNNIIKEANTNKISMDTSATIDFDKYATNNLDLSSSFKLDPTSNDNATEANAKKSTVSTVNDIKSGGVLQTYQEENILDDRMNSVYLPPNSAEVYLYIDSKDRDFEKFKNANGYEIDLTEKALNRVKYIELEDVILIDSSQTDMSSDNLETPPYLLLEIDELSRRKSVAGSNKHIESAFAVLKNYKDRSGYKYYKLNVSKRFSSTIGLQRMTINFRLPSGELFNFGEANNELRRTVNLLTFKVVLG